ncbi:MAG: hypothetical protein P1V35_12725 [Planctomycetota bacterium]|nr:hypothetical protein [Planctomycetota bacterium]
MAQKMQNFSTRLSGWWSPRHTILNEEGETLGVLNVHRNWRGMIMGGEYVPEKGEKLIIRRDPGLQRAQFSLWTDTREWLGSSLRPRLVQRRIDVWSGVRPYRIVPKAGFGRGWRVIASKTGEVASVRQPLLPRGSKWTIQRKMDFELMLFCYFLGSLSPSESFLPSSLDVSSSAEKSKAAPAGS